MNKFIFLDKSGKRRRALIELAKYGALILWLLSLILYHSYNTTPSINGENIHANIDNNIFLIDEISTRYEDRIEVEGIGPFLDIKSDEKGSYLERGGFQNDNQVMLTFDDGPDPYYTPKVLDVLKENNVRAVFFLIGEHMMQYPDITRRIVNEGHEVGLHSLSHPYTEEELYYNLEKTENEFDIPQKIFIAQTGIKTNIFRIPNWGSENTILMNSLVFDVFAEDKGYKVMASTINSHDWEEDDVTKVINNSTGLMTSQVILFHDGGGDRQVTVDALPAIINYYKDREFNFITVDTLLHPNEHAAVQPTFYESMISEVSYSTYWLERNYINIYTVFFRTSLGIALISMFLTVLLATLQVIRKSFRNDKSSPFLYSVSVVVPAYNEENSIRNTVSAILNSDYYNFEVIVVDNNSTDKTRDVLKTFEGDERFKVVKEKKQGKYNALNKGFRIANGKIVVAIDADTLLSTDAISKMVSYFTKEDIVSVAGNIKVGNPINTLTRLQTIEYIVGLNLDRRAFDLFGSVPVVPGAFGAWRRDEVLKAGGYTGDTLTEDADLAIKLLRNGKKIVYADDAVGYTEAPVKVKQLLKQRERWTFGILQILFKNKDIYFNYKYGFLGAILLPYMGIVQMLFMLMAPIVDIIAIITLFIYPQLVIYYFLVFILANIILTSIAFAFEKEKRTWLLFYIPIMRLYYQVLWYGNLYRCVYKAVVGVHIQWNKLEHKGIDVVESEDEARLPAGVIKVE